MQGPFIFPAGPLSPGHIIAVGFVDDDSIGYLEYSLLDTLQFVAGPGNHQDQEEIDHRGHGGF